MSKKLLIETHTIKVSPSQLTENVNRENGNLMVEGILATAEVKMVMDVTIKKSYGIVKWKNTIN